MIVNPEKSTAKNIMESVIINTLKEYPDLLSDAIQSISYGMREAINEMNQERSSLNSALLAALGLLGEKRRNKKLENILTSVILDRLDECSGKKTILENETIESLSSKMNGTVEIGK